MELAKDILFPSDNRYDIPHPHLDRQAGHLELPFVPYGTSFKMKAAKMLHYFIEY